MSEEDDVGLENPIFRLLNENSNNNNNIGINNNNIVLNNNPNINNIIILNNESEDKLEISPEDLYNKKDYENMKDLITCPICLNILFNPVQCNICNKCFCKLCIYSYKDSRIKCPFRCENPKYLENKFVNNVLAILKFKCKNGCEQIINYENLEKHYEEDCDKIDFKTKYKELLKKYKALKNLNNRNNNPFLNNINNNFNNNIRLNNNMIVMPEPLQIFNPFMENNMRNGNFPNHYY